MVQGNFIFSGTLDGVAEGTTTALIYAPCTEALNEITWAPFETCSGSRGPSLATLLGRLAALSELVIVPKLYRRLVTYFTTGHSDLAGFDEWVRADPIHRDDRALLPTEELGNLHDLYDVNSDGITLRFLVETLTFDPDPVLARP